MKKQAFHTNHFFKNSVFLLSGILIGASVFLLTQASYTVQTNIDNAVQVIKRIVLQESDGVTTGSILSGDTIKTKNMRAEQYCDEAGINCVDIDDVMTGYTETDPVFMANSGDYLTGYTETDPVFMANSGDYYMTGQSDDKYLTGEIWTQNGTDVFYTGGNIGIGTTTPSAKLHVDGGMILEKNAATGDICSASTIGEIRFNHTINTNTIEFSCSNTSENHYDVSNNMELCTSYDYTSTGYQYVRTGVYEDSFTTGCLTGLQQP